MTIRRMTLWVLIFIVVTALLLVQASSIRYRFYKDLINECDKVIFKSNQPDSIKTSKVVVLSTSGYPIEFRYYRDKDLIAIDILDEGGKVVRRDILNKDRIRVQSFYDLYGNIGHRYFLDENGNKIASKSFTIPFIGTGRVY